MPEFSYKARDELGRTVKGIQAAEEVDQLAATLRQKNLYLISASEKKSSSAFFGSQKIKRSDLIEFSSHLATILSAGVPILQGLQDLANQRKGTKFGEIIASIIEDVEGGALIHEALARHRQAFGETYINMVEAGETSGNVERVLRELASFLEWQEELRSNIKKITTYPIVVIVAIGILLTLVFAFAFPRISGILLQMKIPLPLSTRVLLGISDIFESYWYIVVTCIFGGVVGFRLGSLTERGRLFLDKWKLRIPIIGGLVRKICLSRFAHYLSLLLEAGIGIIQALSIVETVVGNQVIAQAIRRAREEVQVGSSLTDSLRTSGEFPPMTIRMISIGESSGTLSDSLTKVSNYYDQEVPTTVKKMLSAMEPALILFLALVVMVVALSIYLPIYKSIGMIGK